MHRVGLAVCLGALLLACPPPLGAGDEDGLKAAAALQKLMHRTITQVEPSVVCVITGASSSPSAFNVTHVPPLLSLEPAKMMSE